MPIAKSYNIIKEFYNKYHKDDITPLDVFINKQIKEIFGINIRNNFKDNL